MEKRSPKGIPMLSLKLSVPSVPQLNQPSFNDTAEVSWFGNVGAKRYFLGTHEAEGLSDEELYKLFLQKEGELFAAKNSKTPYQYIKTGSVRILLFSELYRRIRSPHPD